MGKQILYTTVRIAFFGLMGVALFMFCMFVGGAVALFTLGGV
jgi:hypothetical protein